MRSHFETGYNALMRRLSPVLGILILMTSLLLPAEGVFAWNPASQHAIALQAARLAPPDLYRQLRRNRASYLIGVDEPATKGDPSLHQKHIDGAGQLDRATHSAINDAITSIKLHRPFNEISYRLGLVAHYLADANNPLNTAGSDPEERRYHGDFLKYLESTQPRVRTVFYGFYPRYDETHVDRILDASFSRSRRFYPLVGREYRRVGFASGQQAFDDRSTAFAIAALARSHAVSDIAEALRYIWISAGGIDTRTNLPLRGERAIHLP